MLQLAVLWIVFGKDWKTYQKLKSWQQPSTTWCFPPSFLIMPIQSFPPFFATSWSLTSSLSFLITSIQSLRPILQRHQSACQCCLRRPEWGESAWHELQILSISLFICKYFFIAFKYFYSDSQVFLYWFTSISVLLFKYFHNICFAVAIFCTSMSSIS